MSSIKYGPMYGPMCGPMEERVNKLKMSQFLPFNLWDNYTLNVWCWYGLWFIYKLKKKPWPVYTDQTTNPPYRRSCSVHSLRGTVAPEMKRSILRERATATTLPGSDTAPWHAHPPGHGRHAAGACCRALSCSRGMLGCWGNCWEVAQPHIMQTINCII